MINAASGSIITAAIYQTALLTELFIARIVIVNSKDSYRVLENRVTKFYFILV